MLNGECGLITSLGRKALDRLQCTKSWLSANQCYFMRFGAYYLLVFFFEMVGGKLYAKY